jgi:hypothetical protein
MARCDRGGQAGNYQELRLPAADGVTGHDGARVDRQERGSGDGVARHAAEGLGRPEEKPPGPSHLYSTFAVGEPPTTDGAGTFFFAGVRDDKRCYARAQGGEA